MTKFKALSAVVILSAALATPVFAQIGPGSRDGLTPQPGPIYHGYSEQLFSPHMGHRDAMNSMDRGERFKPGSTARRAPVN